MTSFVPLAVRNQGFGEGRDGTDWTQMRETTSARPLSTRTAYPLG